MKKFLALLLVLSICSLCFLVSCRGKDNENEDPKDDSTGEVEDGGDDGDSIIDIGDDEGNGILNEDNIDPNGWTKVD